MKMNQKLILFFLLMSLLTTATNTVYFLQLEMEALRNNIAENLSAVGEKMINEIEQYVQTMDYAIENMTSNAQFMDSMYLLDQLGSDADIVSAQTLVSQALYQSPINRRFYRVNLFNQNGLFISSQFENTGMVQSLSDEAREIVHALPWLRSVEADVYHSHLVPPHPDTWNTARHTQVFSAVRAAVWRGRTIGYLEVSAHVGDLEKIFSVSSMDGVMVQAIFDNGDILYKAQEDPAVYTNLRNEGVLISQTSSGDPSLVVAMQSKSLGLRVYISQSSAVQDQLARALITRYISIAGIILVAAALFIILFSFRLTSSIRRLTKKVRTLPVNDILHLNTPIATTIVTSSGDVEIRELETVFDDLTERLKVSMNNEISMHQANLHAQLNALQAQINPHFIYNSLNIISAKGMESGNEEIVGICDQFAQMLRYSTNLHNSIVTIGEELNHVRSYLHLVKARYESGLSFNIDVPDHAEHLAIPKLILQPLVENTIKHGYSDSIQAIHIELRGAFVEDGLCLTIRDNGQGFSAQALQQLHAAFVQINERITYDQENTADHIGLANTYMRLAYYSGRQIPMKLYNDSGAVIELTIPGIERE